MDYFAMLFEGPCCASPVKYRGKSVMFGWRIHTGPTIRNYPDSLLDDLNMPNTKIKTAGRTSLNDFPGDPNKLLDALLEKLNLKNDAALSRVLEVAPPVISKLRHGTLPIGPTILIRMHEVSNLGIREMRALMLKNEEPEV
jgi:hypothetical protein